MKSTQLLGTLVLASVAACSHSAPVTIAPRADVTTTQWNGRVGTPTDMQGAVQVQGSATMRQGASDAESIVEVHLSNVAPGGQHPWVVESGECGMLGSEVLRVTDSRMLKVGGDGTAAASATLAMPFPTSGDYAVLILASPDNTGTVIGCGNLAPPTSAPSVGRK